MPLFPAVLQVDLPDPVVWDDFTLPSPWGNVHDLFDPSQPKMGGRKSIASGQCDFRGSLIVNGPAAAAAMVAGDIVIPGVVPTELRPLDGLNQSVALGVVIVHAFEPYAPQWIPACGQIKTNGDFLVRVGTLMPDGTTDMATLLDDLPTDSAALGVNLAGSFPLA